MSGLCYCVFANLYIDYVQHFQDLSVVEIQTLLEKGGNRNPKRGVIFEWGDNSQ